jgi:hypothetical protein
MDSSSGFENIAFFAKKSETSETNPVEHLKIGLGPPVGKIGILSHPAYLTVV